MMGDQFLNHIKSNGLMTEIIETKLVTKSCSMRSEQWEYFVENILGTDCTTMSSVHSKWNEV
jgi:hypothetical protein